MKSVVVWSAGENAKDAIALRNKSIIKFIIYSFILFIIVLKIGSLWIGVSKTDDEYAMETVSQVGTVISIPFAIGAWGNYLNFRLANTVAKRNRLFHVYINSGMGLGLPLGSVKDFHDNSKNKILPIGMTNLYTDDMAAYNDWYSVHKNINKLIELANKK